MALATTSTAPISDSMTTEERYRAVFDPIVRPSMRASWDRTWKQWFCTTNTIEENLTPGKLKCKHLLFVFFTELLIGEFEFSSGQYIGLSPKCYYAHSNSGEAKLGTKGVPNTANVGIEDFAACLEYGQEFNVEVQTLTKKKDQISRVKTVKRGLNRVFVKFPTESDAISCSPLTQNGVIL